MAEQLVLVDEEKRVARLDKTTRALGLRGVAEARRVLAEVQAAAADRASAA